MLLPSANPKKKNKNTTKNPFLLVILYIFYIFMVPVKVPYVFISYTLQLATVSINHNNMTSWTKIFRYIQDFL